MATDTGRDSGIAERERRMFFYFAISIGVWVLIGFGMFILVGISSFQSPWWVHMHAVSFLAWIVMYILQNLLIMKGDVARHQSLGRVGSVLAIWMVLVALVITPTTISTDRVPPFFTPPVFLALDWINILCFAGLVLAALLMLKRTDWHKRLMLCATICVIAPAFGRLLALAGAPTPWNQVGVLLLYVAIVAFLDRSNTGRFHPAFLWGGAAIFSMAPTISLLVGIAGFQELASGFTD